MAENTVLPVILYHYEASPFASKVKNILALKRIPHSRVQVSYIPPRRELLEDLGIAYRRIPVLAIGNDVYCDSSLIASVLERRFPPSQGYDTLFPLRKGSDKADVSSTKVFATYYIEGEVFTLATDHLAYEKLPANFIQDRSSFSGRHIDVGVILARRSDSKSTIASHLALLERQLADGREWLMDTVSPSLADISAHFLYSWMRTMRSLHDLFDPQEFAMSLSWLSRMSNYLENRQRTTSPIAKITGGEAAKLIGSSPSEDLNVVGFEAVEARRLGVKRGDSVLIAPRDTGKVPTSGNLVALNREEAVIEVRGPRRVRCHFPRLGFSIKSEGNSSVVNAKL
ncbi:hypothetical protein AcW1_004435 [Taiwanofungus camphoratus]|nr:hypothetical protein AcW2_006559 [Antrodia cinnamomea]KAI0939369.1 hypothetical protein AcV5_000809 [Antrodia cinnamomea]KAI0952291.1 hypothetical protein AcV7_008151 [Antrodia cinnamomea]KAI0959675.1 hypothetical protein AcW1_004435 [Antrodia cinnamomea]